MGGRTALATLLGFRHVALRRHVSIAAPVHHLSWLGISRRAWARCCKSRGWRSLDYGRLDYEHEAAHPSHELPTQLRDSLLYATCVATDSLPSELNDEHEPVRRVWEARIAENYDRIRKIVIGGEPSLAVVIQGFEPQNAIARCCARELGLPVLALENTTCVSRMLWDSVAGITNRNLARNYYWRCDDVDQWECDQYCAEFIRNTKRLKSEQHRSPSVRCGRLTKEEPILFLGQVYTDSSQVFGMRRWASPVEVLRHCVRWCKQNHQPLVVKLHPKEVSGRNAIDNRPYDKLTYRKIMADEELNEGLKDIAAVIDCSNQFDTYELIDQCRLAVTVNSQAGLEAAIRGKRVVVCGDAFYGDLGFTWDAPCPGVFEAVVREALSSDPSPEIARRFTYIFFERYCREKSESGLATLIEENLACH